MEIPKIFSLLLEDKTLQLEFSSRKEAENFRSNLAQYKIRQETPLLQLNFMMPEEVKRLSFRLKPAKQLTGYTYFAIVKLLAREDIQRRQYEVTIL